jgi:hypothetical protein
MRILKNLFFGFLVSFLGSLPLGYLNIVGVEVYTNYFLESLIFYLIGVLCIEAVVIYFTIVFANQLITNEKWMKNIDFFAVVFLVGLSFLFFKGASPSIQQSDYIKDYIQYSTFVIGMVLCAFNFLQIPFWVGWNLFLLNANRIDLQGTLKLYYILGTLVGTFFGMLLAIVVLSELSTVDFSFTRYILPVVVPVFFLVLAALQARKVYIKYIKM